ncbi:MAG: hypothetical protein GIKADHBN_01719 [Phycisphaerales bacterium]|nr:hypothetical protein [Phycisphaerales bacterium]
MTTTVATSWLIALQAQPEHELLCGSEPMPGWCGTSAGGPHNTSVLAATTDAAIEGRHPGLDRPERRLKWKSTPWSLAFTTSPAAFVRPTGFHEPLDLHERATGWPCLAMVARTVTARKLVWISRQPPQVRFDEHRLVNRAINLGSRDTPRYLPLEPLIGGFLANTTLYAVAWLLLLTVPALVRTHVRRRRRRCTGCGYSLADIPETRCPECGRVLTLTLPGSPRFPAAT